jgi:hypothetical protein
MGLRPGQRHGSCRIDELAAGGSAIKEINEPRDTDRGRSGIGPLTWKSRGAPG